MRKFMDNAFKFNSINDLYKRILPSINTKIDDLKREKITDIKADDIWRYCVNKKWKNKTDLRIYEMVDDILNIDILDLKLYLKDNLNRDGLK